MVPHGKNTGFGPVNTSRSPHARLNTLEFRNISLNEGFWTKKINVNRKTSLKFGFEMLKKAGNFDNLRIASGEITYLPAIASDEAPPMWSLPLFTVKVEPITCPVKTALPPANCSNCRSSPARK